MPGKEETFEDLFDEATQADEKPAGSDVTVDTKKEEDTPKKEEGTPVKEESPIEESPKEEEPVKETPKEEEKVEEKEEPTEDDILADLTEEDPALILQRYKTLQGMYRANKKRLEEKETPPEEAAPVAEAPVEEAPKGEVPSTEIDMSWIDSVMEKDSKSKEFEQELPDVKEYVTGTLKAVMSQYIQAESQALSTIMQQVHAAIDPVTSTIAEQRLSTHRAEIKKSHPDFETYEGNGDLVNWINSQSERYKAFYTEVYKEGNTEEVVDLFNKFKESNGITTVTKKEKAKPKVTPETKTTPVDLKAPVAKDDFEAAFDEAIQGV